MMKIDKACIKKGMVVRAVLVYSQLGSLGDSITEHLVEQHFINKWRLHNFHKYSRFTICDGEWWWLCLSQLKQAQKLDMHESKTNV